mmetsp:Transcript_81369/g.94856  ORF Transcript_81369/g.94856 Transcript_81369/m.94856 type:complete len:356 (+) Transcript_81369:41-1108(+)
MTSPAEVAAACAGASPVGADGVYKHPHWHVNKSKPSDYWDYENSTLEFSSIEPYECIQKIGRGKYSEVFRARNRNNGEICVIKVLKPVKAKKIHREITILQNLYGGPNVVRLLDVAQEPETETPVLVFESVNAQDFRTLYPRLSNFDVRFYMYEILKTLDFAHSMGVFHRDIKPHNIMIDPTQRKVRVIDWGLGEYYHHGMQYNVRVASRYYKGPELLIGYRLYDYSLDIWSLGCVFAGILFRQEPFFKGADNSDQLVQIANVLGAEGLLKYCATYRVRLDDSFTETIVRPNKPRVRWESFVNSRVASLCEPSALDLLDKMLVYDHQLRILPRDAMAHPYFDAIRQQQQVTPESN